MKLGMITTPNAGGIKRVHSFGLEYAEFGRKATRV